VFDIYNELRTLTTSLERDGVEYALCGGLAMAVHGYVRATVDIDLLVLSDQLESVFEVAKRLGYDLKSSPMEFADGKMIIYRVTKAFPGSEDYLSVDLILVTDEIKSVWESREKVKLEHGFLTVVSRRGLIELKQLRGSKQDMADIDRLKGESDEP
jgi:hypothetical protein